jgi:DNA-binding transcriptional ArsR family regulator
MLNRTASLNLMFQALADPTRRAIVERLTQGPASVSDLARPLAMSLPAVGQHLKVLEASGLISTIKVGRVRICRIERHALLAADSWIAERMLWEQRFGRLGKLLTEIED